MKEQASLNESSSPETNQSCAAWLVVGLIWAWTLLVLFGRFSVEILASGIKPGAAETGFRSLPLISGAAILLPCVLGAFLVGKMPALKRSGVNLVLRTWAWAAGFVLISVPARLGETTALQKTSIVQVICWLVFLALYLVFKRYKQKKMVPETTQPGDLFTSRHFFDWRSAAALLVSGVMAIAWFAWGALGSPLDTLLAIFAGLVFGVVAAILVETEFIRPYLELRGSAAGRFIGGGFFIAIALMIMSSALGFAFGVMQLLVLISLAPLGWVWIGFRLLGDADLERPGPGEDLPPAQPWQGANYTYPTLLIGLAAALPLIFFDANELAVIISGSQGEVLGWALQAALAACAAGFLAAGVLFMILFARQRRPEDKASKATGSPKTWRYLIAGGLVWATGLLVFLAIGQPGFFGERMFVVLNTQADLNGVEQFTDPIQRRQEVYNRLVAQAGTSQSRLRQILDRWRIGYQPYYLVNAIELPKNPFLRAWLERQPEVDRVLPSPRLRPLAAVLPISQGTATAPETPDWNLTLVGADRVWQEFNVTGEGIIIGQSDSGVEWEHPELVEAYRGKNDHNYNWFDPWNNSPAPVDYGGHGTHTLGSVLGQHTGVAPGASWIACANLVRNLGNPGYYLDCMQFMLAPFPLDGDPFQDGRPELGAMVLNNSWGCPEMEGCDQDTFLSAVLALRKAGIFTVASAGNDGPGCATIADPLAIYPHVFTVGAINRDGALAMFSSLGPVPGASKPDLVAPGEGVLSAFPASTYSELSGTSMAGPHVVGAVALLWSANPALIGDIEKTEAILRQTSTPYTAELPGCPGAQDQPSTAVGAGILNVYEAVKSQR